MVMKGLEISEIPSCYSSVLLYGNLEKYPVFFVLFLKDSKYDGVQYIEHVLNPYNCMYLGGQS